MHAPHRAQSSGLGGECDMGMSETLAARHRRVRPTPIDTVPAIPTRKTHRKDRISTSSTATTASSTSTWSEGTQLVSPTSPGTHRWDDVEVVEAGDAWEGKWGATRKGDTGTWWTSERLQAEHKDYFGFSGPSSCASSAHDVTLGDVPLAESPTLPPIDLPLDDSPTLGSTMTLPPIMPSRRKLPAAAPPPMSLDQLFLLDGTFWSEKRLGKRPAIERSMSDLMPNRKAGSSRPLSSSSDDLHSLRSINTTQSAPSIPARTSSKGRVRATTTVEGVSKSVPRLPPARGSSLRTSKGSAPASLPTSTSLPVIARRPQLSRSNTSTSFSCLLDTVPEVPKDLDCTPEGSWALRPCPLHLHHAKSQPHLSAHIMPGFKLKLRRSGSTNFAAESSASSSTSVAASSSSSSVRERGSSETMRPGDIERERSRFFSLRRKDSTRRPSLLSQEFQSSSSSPASSSSTATVPQIPAQIPEPLQSLDTNVPLSDWPSEPTPAVTSLNSSRPRDSFLAINHAPGELSNMYIDFSAPRPFSPESEASREAEIEQSSLQFGAINNGLSPHDESLETVVTEDHEEPVVPAAPGHELSALDETDEPHDAEAFADLLEDLAAIDEAETWLWPSPPPRSPSSMTTSSSGDTLGGPITPPTFRFPLPPLPSLPSVPPKGKGKARQVEPELEDDVADNEDHLKTPTQRSVRRDVLHGEREFVVKEMERKKSVTIDEATVIASAAQKAKYRKSLAPAFVPK